ncbi:MAG: hypothetical protein JST50_06285 [Bacteroidetes bacterium]|jgi:hypothetical protein|nr:hypothetical protein [Bacteroidota bacterium]
MRLSYTPISLLHIFLITFLTLFLKPDAKAQTMLAVNVKHHLEKDLSLINVGDNDLIHSEHLAEKHDEDLVNEGCPSTVNFLHPTTLVLPIKNAGKIYSGYHPLRVRIYSASIPHSMRITVKLFKVVIVPLWHSK